MATEEDKVVEAIEAKDEAWWPTLNNHSLVVGTNQEATADTMSVKGSGSNSYK